MKKRTNISFMSFDVWNAFYRNAIPFTPFATRTTLIANVIKANLILISSDFLIASSPTLIFFYLRFIFCWPSISLSFRQLNLYLIIIHSTYMSFCFIILVRVLLLSFQFYHFLCFFHCPLYFLHLHILFLYSLMDEERSWCMLHLGL